jgi:phospholipid-binding lipoprotein MlaA
MRKYMISLSDWLSSRLAVGVLLVFLMTGCAHQGHSRIGSDAPPPAKASVTLSASPAVDPETGAEDDFFDDEFESERPLVHDPLMAVNRIIFKFNDKLYFWCLKPVARGYRAIVPEPIRLSIGNLLTHAGTPIRLANDLLQGKFKAAGAEFGRFFVNSTAGLLGLGNPAANYPALNPPREDLGQTLGTYGIGNGFYLMLPILGPSTLRDTVGMVGDFAFDPVTYLHPWYVSDGVRAVDITNRLSFHIGDYEALKGSSIDPYLMLRSAYIQHRRKAVGE